MFRDYDSEIKKKIYLTLQLVRFGLMCASTVLLFTTNGHEALFGFWVLTNAVFFLTDSTYLFILYVVEMCNKNCIDKSKDTYSESDKRGKKGVVEKPKASVTVKKEKDATTNSQLLNN